MIFFHSFAEAGQMTVKNPWSAIERSKVIFNKNPCNG